MTPIWLQLECCNTGHLLRRHSKRMGVILLRKNFHRQFEGKLHSATAPVMQQPPYKSGAHAASRQKYPLLERAHDAAREMTGEGGRMGALRQHGPQPIFAELERMKVCKLNGKTGDAMIFVDVESPPDVADNKLQVVPDPRHHIFTVRRI